MVVPGLLQTPDYTGANIKGINKEDYSKRLVHAPRNISEDL
jgi:hypothetical protein